MDIVKNIGTVNGIFNDIEITTTIMSHGALEK